MEKGVEGFSAEELRLYKKASNISTRSPIHSPKSFLGECINLLA